MAEDILVGHLDRESSLRSNAVHCCLYVNLMVMLVIIVTVMMIIVTSDEYSPQLSLCQPGGHDAGDHCDSDDDYCDI